MKRRISTSTLLGNWKNYGTRRWQLYQSWLVLLVLTDYWRDWRTWKLADERRPSKLLHYRERPEYWEESWRLEETCCHSSSSERPSANADMKNSQWVNNNNNYNTCIYSIPPLRVVCDSKSKLKYRDLLSPQIMG